MKSKKQKNKKQKWLSWSQFIFLSFVWPGMSYPVLLPMELKQSAWPWGEGEGQADTCSHDVPEGTGAHARFHVKPAQTSQRYKTNRNTMSGFAACSLVLVVLSSPPMASKSLALQAQARCVSLRHSVAKTMISLCILLGYTFLFKQHTKKMSMNYSDQLFSERYGLFGMTQGLNCEKRSRN